MGSEGGIVVSAGAARDIFGVCVVLWLMLLYYVREVGRGFWLGLVRDHAVGFVFPGVVVAVRVFGARFVPFGLFLFLFAGRCICLL